MVRSYPPGAQLFINEKFVGIAPTVYSLPHSKIDVEQKVRLERDGYQTLEGRLRTQICGGRIAGGIFTLGLALLIRGPTCFVSPQDFSLEPKAGVSGEGASPESSPAGVEQRLQRLERMRDRGQINQQEYDQYRKEVLKGL